jgi:hypothetical protein
VQETRIIIYFLNVIFNNLIKFGYYSTAVGNHHGEQQVKHELACKGSYVLTLLVCGRPNISIQIEKTS